MAEAAGGARRQHLTLLFADLCDSTLLGEQMEAEHYAAMLAAFRALCREILPRHGGHIARIQGDGLLAFFGWPQSSEDDGRHAAEAALELHAAVARLGFDTPLPEGLALRLHSGIHAGLVLVSEGDVERGRFELLGNVPNIAARLSALAGRDDIVVTEDTLGPALHYFVTSERQAVQVRGREAPLVVCRVLGRAEARNRFEAQARRGLSPFVGREAELRQLRERLREALAGANVCCVVSAPPGMGKSRLVEELVRLAADERCSTLRGCCDGAPGAAPLLPFTQALGPLLGETRPDREALCGLFDRLAAEQPLFLVLDDWQWADEASQIALEALRALARPLFVLLATRGGAEEALPAAPAETLALAPLDDDAAARIAEAMLPGVDPFVIADIVRYAGGTPLFLEELCHAARAAGAAWATTARPGGPAWLAALIVSRASRLPERAAGIVRAAAVIGNAFPAWLLERIAGCAPDDPVLAALAEADLLFPGDTPGTLRFKHGITRDVIEAAIGLHERARLHGAIADALAADEAVAEANVEALAHHSAAAGRHEAAARHGERAGDKALTASALDRARTQYGAALAALEAIRPATRENDLRWCRIVQKLGLACTFDPLSLPDALARMERGVALARHWGDLAVAARAEYWLAYAQYAKGMALEAEPHCRAALDLALEGGDERLASLARTVYGQVLIQQAQYDRALPMIDAGLGQRRHKERPGVADGVVYTLSCKALLLGDRGLFAQAEECFAEALALVADTQHQVASSVRHWRSLVLQWQGRWEEAVRTAETSVRIAEAVRSRHQVAVGRSMEGYARWVRSQRAEDLQMLREATAWIDARQGGLGMSLNHSWLVEASLVTGSEDEARRHAARMFRRARASDRIGEALGCRALARRAAKLNQLGRAERYLALAEAAAQARGSPHERAKNRLCEAVIRFDGGQVARARALLDEALSAFEAMQMPWFLERARRLAQRIG